MRTLNELVEKLNHRDKNDIFGWEVEVLVPYLPFEMAKPWLKPEVTAETWVSMTFTEEAVLKEMRDYMAFAWGKVENHRGISASRSVEKMAAWCYIMGNDELVAYLGDGGHYAQYGAPMLAKVCQTYDLPIPDLESLRNMIAGLPCWSGCENGCG